jgi:hypothetical protein
MGNKEGEMKTKEDLAFYTNEELINELFSRQTFAGFIVRPHGPIEVEENADVMQFDLTWSPRLTTEAIRQILEEAIVRFEDDKENN